jgi:hypothetical protein
MNTKEKITKKEIRENIKVASKWRKYTDSDLPCVKWYFHCFDGWDRKEEIVNYIYKNQQSLTEEYLEKVC